MPRLLKSIPKYRKHRASGQAVVTLNGRDHYLGPHGTRASTLEYDRLIAEWLARGRHSFADSDAVEEVTVVELVAAFWDHAQRHYVKHGRPTAELVAMKTMLRYLRQMYGPTRVADFRPHCLEAIRQKMIDAGNARGYINQNTSRLKHIFKWGVSKELVPESIYRTLSTVAGLQEGKCDVRESEPVAPVDDATIAATLRQLPDVVAVMVRLQRATGMRPGEVVLVRPCDIERDGDVWTYSPREHKMEHKRRGRRVLIGPKGQELLRPFLQRPANEYCFVPTFSKTGRYTTSSYRDAVHRGCDAAFPAPMPLGRMEQESLRAWRDRLTPDQREKLAQWQSAYRWNVNQIRHTVATEVRRKFGLEATQAVLGHAQADVTQIYAERDMATAAAVMREVG